MSPALVAKRHWELRNDVRFALSFKVGRKQQPLTDTERDRVAAAIVEHIRLCNWRVEREPPWGGFSELGRDRATPKSGDQTRDLPQRTTGGRAVTETTPTKRFNGLPLGCCVDHPCSQLGAKPCIRP
jgi:hypothetical protein